MPWLMDFLFFSNPILSFLSTSPVGFPKKTKKVRGPADTGTAPVEKKKNCRAVIPYRD